VPPAPPKVGDLSRMFARILPFGLDKAMAPLGKEMVEKGKDLLRGFKIPESWKPALKDAFKGFNLPNSLGGGAPTLPRAPFGIAFPVRKWCWDLWAVLPFCSS